MASWQPRTQEDQMLHAYAAKRGGATFAEVPIGGPGGPAEWPSGCTIRRLDGVRIANSRRAQGIVRWNRHESDAFITAIHHPGAVVELIEVKPRLNRSAIGQMVAGRAMFGRQYRVTIDRSVIVCAQSDAALAWVCGQEGITVEVIRGGR